MSAIWVILCNTKFSYCAQRLLGDCGPVICYIMVKCVDTVTSDENISSRSTDFILVLNG